MKAIIDWFKNAFAFVKNIGTIIQEWIKEYGFQNALLIILALILWFVIPGAFWSYWGHAIFWFFIGRNVVALEKVWKDIVKPKLGL